LERSSTKEVQDLQLGDGEIFPGEGILAITKALLQAGYRMSAGTRAHPFLT
jgi:indolepyruvate ferredoxin oxidoreductase alpha subunit